MAVICDFIGQVRDLRFQRGTPILFFPRRRWIVKRLMFLQTFAHFEGQIQSRETPGRPSRASRPRASSAGYARNRRGRACIRASISSPEWPNGECPRSWAKAIASARSSFSDKRARDRAADRRHFDGVRQARAEMIARAVQKNLRLVFQPAKGARMNDAGAIALKLRPISMTRFGIFRARANRPIFAQRARATDRSSVSICSRVFQPLFTPRFFVDCRSWRVRSFLTRHLNTQTLLQLSCLRPHHENIEESEQYRR